MLWAVTLPQRKLMEMIADFVQCFEELKLICLSFNEVCFVIAVETWVVQRNQSNINIKKKCRKIWENLLDSQNRRTSTEPSEFSDDSKN